MQGTSINGYTLHHQLGVGGMAEVWLAENAIGKKAAVKLLLPKFCQDEAIVARFENEAKVMVQLDHPNIRQVYDYGNIDGRPTIIMEYLEGDDLKALMKSGRKFSEDELRKWWNQIADALNYTHGKGIVHRDIKPSNIFLDKKGNIKLLDFGIAKIKESISMTQTGAIMGTLMYMSPEQVEDSKHIGPQSDIYSLAVTFVHLLTGKAPYDSTTSSDYAIRKGIVELPLDLSKVPAEWQTFLAPYLEKDPAKRPILRAFEAVKPGDPIPSDDDEGTIVGGANQRNQKPERSQKKQPKNETEPVSEPVEEPKNKKGLWIRIGALMAVLASLLVIMWPKSDKDLVPVTEDVPSETSVADEITINDTDLFIKVSTSGEAYLGEQLELTYLLYTRVPISSLLISKEPSYEGFLTEDITAPNLNQRNEYFNGVEYTTCEIRRMKLVPQRLGSITIDPMELEGDCDVAISSEKNNNNDPFDFFFNNNNHVVVKKKIVSESFVIEVKEKKQEKPVAKEPQKPKTQSVPEPERQIPGGQGEKEDPDCEYMMNSADSYFNKGDYSKALKIYNMVVGSCDNYRNVSVKIKECERNIQEEQDYRKCYSIKNCEYYLNTFPDGRYVAEVKVKKANLERKEVHSMAEEDQDYQKCNTIENCDYYLQTYPRGRYVHDVLLKMEKLQLSNE